MDKRRLTKIGFLVGVVVLWQGLASLNLWPNYVFPSFCDVGTSLVAGFSDGTLTTATLSSLGRLFLGYGLSLAIGIPLGLLWGQSKLMQDTVGTVILGLQALPSITWLPIALIWFGLTEAAVLFVVFMGAVWSIAISTKDGILNIPVNSLRAARNLGAQGLFLATRVLIPAALPSVVSGMKLGWSFAWRSLMAGELLYFGVGQGQQLNQGRELNDMSLVVAVMLVIVTLGLVFDKLVFQRMERAIRAQFNLG